MNKKLDALLKNFGTETVAVIHTSTVEPLDLRFTRPSTALDAPKTVALVTVDKKLSTDDKLNKAFMLTNSIEDAWWNNKNVTKLFDGDSCRSTMAGDMVLVGNEKFVCKSSGWSKVS
jgi:hypothetical protein